MLLPHQKRRAVVVFILIGLNGLTDVIGLASILPVLYTIKDTSIVFSNKYLSYTYHLFGFSDTGSFSIFLVLTLLFIFIIKNSISTFIVYVQQKFANNTAVELISLQYKRYLSKDYLYFKSTNSNYIIRDIATIPTDFSHGVLIPTINFSTELFVALFILLAILIYNPVVCGLIFVIMMPTFLLFYQSIKEKIHHYGKETNEIRSTTFKTIFEAIFGIDEVKLANKESFFIKRSMASLSYYYNLFTKVSVLQSIPIKIIEVTAVAGIVMLYFYSIWLSDDQSSLFTLLIIFATAAYRLMPSMNRMMSALIDIKNKSYVFETLSEIGHDQENHTEKLSLTFEKEITFNGVDFSFPGKAQQVLSNFNLTIQKGEKVGLVGESGAGKSTILKILLGFLSPQKGTVSVDGNTLNDKTLHSWREKIGYVQQDFYLLDTSLAENIAFGETKENINFERLKKCIKLAQIEELVASLPGKLEANIGEFGSNLSGGQKQRIAIARALYKKAEVLIFDEATSALDNQTEKEIIETINHLQGNNYTIIMIAHRVSSLKFCDVIYKIKNGGESEKMDYADIA